MILKQLSAFQIQKKNEEEKSNLNSNLFWKLPQLSQLLVSEHGLVWPVEF